MAEPVSSGPRVSRIAQGAYLVEGGDKRAVVYVASTDEGPWAFYDGRVFRPAQDPRSTTRVRRSEGSAEARQTLTAPMPATVRAVVAQPGAQVRKGDTVVVLEAMKMELPIRAEGDGVVYAVHCEAGELVQPDTVLVEIAPA